MFYLAIKYWPCTRQQKLYRCIPKFLISGRKIYKLEMLLNSPFNPSTVKKKTINKNKTIFFTHFLREHFNGSAGVYMHDWTAIEYSVCSLFGLSQLISIFRSKRTFNKVRELCHISVIVMVLNEDVVYGARHLYCEDFFFFLLHLRSLRRALVLEWWTAVYMSSVGLFRLFFFF